MARGSIRVYQTSSFELSFLKARNEPGLNLNQVNVTKTGLAHVQYRSQSEPSFVWYWNSFELDFIATLDLSFGLVGLNWVGFGFWLGDSSRIMMWENLNDLEK